MLYDIIITSICLSLDEIIITFYLIRARIFFFVKFLGTLRRLNRNGFIYKLCFFLWIKIISCFNESIE